MFIFTVTLLGSAIGKAKEEEKEIRKRQEEEFNLKINDLENKIKALRESGDSRQAEAQIKEITTTRKKHHKQIQKLKGKFAALEFHHAIILPTFGFLSAVFLSEISKSLSFNIYLGLGPWILSLLAIGFGIYKLSRSLLLAQEISRISEELQTKRITLAFKAALGDFKAETEEELTISFKNITFPHTCKPNQELLINFRISLLKGKITHATEIWFLVPDGFVLLDPEESEAWRQAEDNFIPNIRTVRRKLYNVRKSVYTPSYIKLKTPEVEGNYFVLYKLLSDEYNGEREKIEIVVKK
ncbi:MAG TPA: hypothetical protein VII11_00305 [Bacteroidota bacterium]